MPPETQMTMSMTYKEDPYKKGFGPFHPNIRMQEFPENWTLKPRNRSNWLCSY